MKKRKIIALACALGIIAGTVFVGMAADPNIIQLNVSKGANTQQYSITDSGEILLCKYTVGNGSSTYAQFYLRAVGANAYTSRTAKAYLHQYEGNVLHEASCNDVGNRDYTETVILYNFRYGSASDYGYVKNGSDYIRITLK